MTANPPNPKQTAWALLDRPISELDEAELAQAKGMLQSFGLESTARILEYNRNRSVQELIDLYQQGKSSQIQSEPTHTPKRRPIVRTTAPVPATTSASHPTTQQQTSGWEPVAPTTGYEVGQILDHDPTFITRQPTRTPYERIADQCQANPGKPIVLRVIDGPDPKRSLALAERTAGRINSRRTRTWRPETGSYTATAGIPKNHPTIAIVTVRYDTAEKGDGNADQ